MHSTGTSHSVKIHGSSNSSGILTRYYLLFRGLVGWYFKKRSTFEATAAPPENSEIAENGSCMFTPAGNWLASGMRQLKLIRARVSVVFQVALICLSAVTCGMATAYPAIVVPGVSRSGTAVLPSFVSLVAVLYYLTILVGGLASGPVVEKWGRRKFLLAATIQMMAGWLIAGLYKSPSSVLICLMFLGCGTSMTITCVSVYLNEISPKKWVSFSSVVRTSAFFFGVSVTYALGFVFRDDWAKLSIISASIPCTVFFLGLFYLRETKEWLQRLPQTDAEQSVLDDYKEFWTKLSQRSDVAKPFYTLNIVIVLRQLSGTAVLIIFSIDLLERIAPGTDPYAVAFVLGLEFLTGGPLGAALSQRFGVRKPLVYSGCLMSFAMLLLAKLHRISGLRHDEWPTYTAESILVCFVLGHAIFYTVTEALQEKIFPADVRKVCTSISTFNSTLASGITVVTYPLMIKCWGYSTVFMLYATANVLCAVLTIMILTGIDKEDTRVPSVPASTGDDNGLHYDVPRQPATDHSEHAQLHSVSEAEVKATSSDS